MYFTYGEKEIAYLKKADPVLGAAIDKIGYLEREVDSDLFTSVVHQIVGQQISNAALTTVWTRMQDMLGEITPQRICSVSEAELQQCGMSLRKAGYIQTFARQVLDGSLDLEALTHKSDAEVIQVLSAVKGIGIWTAEMLLIFGLQRQDVLSFGDLGIRKGMQLLYGWENVTPELFSICQKRYSPYGTIASLYLWAIAAGAFPELHNCRNVEYCCTISTPVGMMTASSDGYVLTGLWIADQKYFGSTLKEQAETKQLPVFAELERWLTAYFEGENPPVTLPLNPKGTPFRQMVWEILKAVPYGKTTTYGAIAKQLELQTGKRVSAQAVGQAVGHNPIGILIPCHRVIGSDGSLTGYAGGIEVKRKLLREIEHAI